MCDRPTARVSGGLTAYRPPWWDRPLPKTAEVLTGMGATVEKTSPPCDLRWARDVCYAVVVPGFLEALKSETQQTGIKRDELLLGGIRAVENWVATTPKKKIDALKADLPALRACVLKSMAGYDAVLCPVTKSAALEHDQTWDSLRDDFVWTETMSTVWSLPAGTVRCGTSPDGLPIGVQVVGSPCREDIVLAVLSALERELGGWQARISKTSCSGCQRLQRTRRH